MSKVLIADDDRVSRAILERTLEKLDYTSVSVTNGREALDALQEDEDLQIVLIDWVMPEVDGLEVCRQIRLHRKFRYTYVLVITGRSGKQNYLAALDAGADDFITKPVEPDELRARLLVAQRILGLQAEIRQLQGLLSICSYCKRVQDGDGPGTWLQIETYISRRADTSFSHGICPQCEKKYFPE